MATKFLSVPGDASVEILQPGGRITVATPEEVGTPTPPAGSDLYQYKSTFASTPLPGDGSTTMAFQIAHTCRTSKRLIECTVQGAADYTGTAIANGAGSFDTIAAVDLVQVPCVYQKFWDVNNAGTPLQFDGSAFTATWFGIVDATPDVEELVGNFFQWSAPAGAEAANWIWSGFMRVSDYSGEVAP